MWDWIKWLPYIAAIITIYKAVKKLIINTDFAKVQKIGDQLYVNLKRLVNHPLYNKIGIGVNALLLLVSFIYAAFGFALLVLKGHSILYASIPLIILASVSINLFYQSIKLYR